MADVVELGLFFETVFEEKINDVRRVYNILNQGSKDYVNEQDISWALQRNPDHKIIA